MERLFYQSENYINPIALRKAKIVYNFGLSECNRVKDAFSFVDIIRANSGFQEDEVGRAGMGVGVGRFFLQMPWRTT